MKTPLLLALLLALATPVGAAVLWNESVNGDLSSNPAGPTALVFAQGANTIIGTVRNSNNTTTGDRDYITFTVPANKTLVALNALVYTPDFLGFCAFNAGTTSYIPSVATDTSFLAGVHISAADVGTNMLPRFVANVATTNALAAPELLPGNYCFLIQQTGTALQSYSLEFVLDGPVPSENASWGAIKSLYR